MGRVRMYTRTVDRTMVGPHASAREFAAQHRVGVGHLVAREVWVERWPKARVGSGGSRAPGPLVLALCPVRSPPLPRSFIIFISAKGLPDEELLKTSRLDCSKLEDGAGGGGPGAALVRVRARALPPGHTEGPPVPRGAAAPRAPPRPAGGDPALRRAPPRPTCVSGRRRAHLPWWTTLLPGGGGGGGRGAGEGPPPPPSPPSPPPRSGRLPSSPAPPAAVFVPPQTGEGHSGRTRTALAPSPGLTRGDARRAAV